MEWLTMAPVVAYAVWSGSLFLEGSLTELVKHPGISALAVSTPWTLLVVSYGVIIPNTWRRCAAGAA